MITVAQRSMASGELSPSLYGRTDFSRYFTGLAKARNVIIKKSGGAENRPGTEFVCEVADSTKTVRFIPFVFNSSQTYVLEMGNQYFRIIKNGVLQTLATQAITGISNANPGVLTYDGSDTYAAGDIVYISGVVGNIANNVNGRWIKVGTVTAGSNTFNMLNLDGTNFNTTSLGTYTSGGTIAEAYKVASTYVEADLAALKYAQSADIVTIAHPSYIPREIARTGDTSWTITDFSINTDTEVGVILGSTIAAVGAGGAVTYSYKYQTVSASGFESTVSNGFNTKSQANAATLSATDYTLITITSTSGSVYEYNVYKKDTSTGIYGYIGTFQGTQFRDIGFTPDITDQPPDGAAYDILTTDDFPSCPVYYQQRIGFGNKNNDTEYCIFSATGQYHGFFKKSPVTDSSVVEFSLAGSQVNSIQHMLDLGSLVIFTDSGVKVAQGNAAGILTPTDVNLKQYSYNGSAVNPAPIGIDNSAIYVQSGGSIVRDLGFDINVDGYRGDDLTNFSSHLFEGYTIVDWAYQRNPNSVVWAVRSDGVVLSLTYIKEQGMLAWTRHDFGDGLAENVCAVPNGNTYDVYFTIKRTINGGVKRYIERLTDRFFTDPKDYNFTDCSLSYDGRNTGSTTMTLSTSGGWTYDDIITITASASYFTAAKEGNQIHFPYTDADTGEDRVLRVNITTYSSATVMTGKPERDVPASLRSAATTNWAEAVDRVTGLWHLEGEDVSVIGDGYVVGSPNNPAYTTYTVTNGLLDFDQCYTVIRVGLPYISDIETLAIDSYNGETIADKESIVKDVTMQVEKTRGMFVGTECPEDDRTNTDQDLLFNLIETKERDFEFYDEGIDLGKGKVDIQTVATFSKNAKVFIRQVDPQPMSVLSIIPRGDFPFRR